MGRRSQAAEEDLQDADTVETAAPVVPGARGDARWRPAPALPDGTCAGSVLLALRKHKSAARCVGRAALAPHRAPGGHYTSKIGLYCVRLLCTPPGICTGSLCAAVYTNTMCLDISLAALGVSDSRCVVRGLMGSMYGHRCTAAARPPPRAPLHRHRCTHRVPACAHRASPAAASQRRRAASYGLSVARRVEHNR